MNNDNLQKNGHSNLGFKLCVRALVRESACARE